MSFYICAILATTIFAQNFHNSPNLVTLRMRSMTSVTRSDHTVYDETTLTGRVCDMTSCRSIAKSSEKTLFDNMLLD